MQKGRQPSRLNQRILCPQLMSEENNERRLTPPCGKRQTQRGVSGEEASSGLRRKVRSRISCQPRRRRPCLVITSVSDLSAALGLPVGCWGGTEGGDGERGARSRRRERSRWVETERTWGQRAAEGCGAEERLETETRSAEDVTHFLSNSFGLRNALAVS